MLKSCVSLDSSNDISISQDSTLEEATVHLVGVIIES